MKNIFVISLFFVVLALSRGAVYGADIDEPIGHLVGFEGTSALYRGLKEMPAEALAPLFANDSVRCNEDAKAKVLLEDGTVLLLGASSEARLAQVHFKFSKGIRVLEIELVNGGLMIVVPSFLGQESKVMLSTPAAVIEVAEGELVIEHDPNGDTSVVSVLSGQATVRNLFSDRDALGSTLGAGQTTGIQASGGSGAASQLRQEDQDMLHKRFNLIPQELLNEAGDFKTWTYEVLGQLFSATELKNRRPNLPVYGPREAAMEAGRSADTSVAIPPQNGSIRINWKRTDGIPLEEYK